jgi:hypothetical protein
MAAAQAVTMVGVGIGVIGQMFANAGMEEIGEIFTGIGNVLTVIGTGLMALVPLINLLGTTVTVNGTKMSVAGWLV